MAENVFAMQRLLQLKDRVVDEARRLWSVHGDLSNEARLVDRALDPQLVACAAATMAWAKDNIGEPHPDIGRGGPVCPFVPKALSTNRFHILLRTDVDGTDLHALRGAIVGTARGFLKTYAVDHKEHAMANLTLVFPSITEERGVVMEHVHTEVKSLLMNMGVMCSSFHPLCDKPAIRNQAFRDAYKAPYACFTMRHMGLHDIIFLSHNEEGFEAYHARFAPKYARKRVSNEHGYVDLYDDAVKRFAYA